VTDVSDCSVELNVVIQNTFCVSWKTCRISLGPVFQSYVQDTKSGVYEFGISKQ